MDAKTQIIVLLTSYIFGFISLYLLKLNNFFIKKQKRIYRSIITMLLMYNIVLIYIIIIFKINKGDFHPYLFLMLAFGLYSSSIFTNKMLKNVKYRGFIEKIKKK